MTRITTSAFATMMMVAGAAFLLGRGLAPAAVVQARHDHDDEHADSIATLIELQRIDPDACPSKETKQRWLDGLHNAVDHLTTSYTLLNYLRSMSPEQKQTLLDRHAKLHQRGHRWSQLHPSNGDSAPRSASETSRGESHDE